MNEKKRPTCVTVIGWVWVIIGAFMCFSAIMGLFAFLMMNQISGADPTMVAEKSAFLKLFPFLAITQFGVSILAIISGINFLKLKSWARSVLEGLTWLFLFFIVGFGIFMVFFVTAQGETLGFTIFLAIMCLVSLLFYGIPLGIVLKFLRGDTVKVAMKTDIERVTA